MVHLFFRGSFWGSGVGSFFVECPKRYEEEGLGDGHFSPWGPRWRACLPGLMWALEMGICLHWGPVTIWGGVRSPGILRDC
jgi:hypothetical protein